MTPVTCRTQRPRPPTAHCVAFPFPATPYHRDTVTPSTVGVSHPSVRDERPPTGRLGSTCGDQTLLRLSCLCLNSSTSGCISPPCHYLCCPHALAAACLLTAHHSTSRKGVYESGGCVSESSHLHQPEGPGAGLCSHWHSHAASHAPQAAPGQGCMVPRRPCSIMVLVASFT
jgi:hypothetical protein